MKTRLRQLLIVVIIFEGYALRNLLKCKTVYRSYGTALWLRLAKFNLFMYRFNTLPAGGWHNVGDTTSVVDMVVAC